MKSVDVYVIAFLLTLVLWASPNYAQTLVTSMTGQSNNDRFSNDMQSVGDVNGDGYLDFAIGASWHSSEQGILYVYLGGPTISNTPSYTITSGAGGQLGGTIGFGDINGDGYSDIILSDVYYNSSTGKVFVYFGGQTPHVTPDITLIGPNTQSGFGGKVLGADLNGDGYGDVIVSATDAPDVNTHSGRVYVYYGGASVNATPDVTLSGVASSYFGTSLAAGDFNHDGHTDLAVSAMLYNAWQGAAYIFYGNGSGVNTTPDVTFYGEVVNDQYGRSITALDMNSDGYSDLAVGAPFGGSRLGRVYVYFGGSNMNNVADLTITGSDGGDDLFGMEVANAKDVNNDGYEDLLAGSQNALNQQGKAFVFYGGSSLNGVADLTIIGDAGKSFMGEQLAGLGDINHDGKNEFIVGGTYWNTNWRGKAAVYYDETALQAGSVSITAPNGGENWYALSSHNITWNAVSVTNVKLEFSSDGGTNWSTIVGSTAGNTGSYSWTVPSSLSVNCKVRVSDAASAATNSVSAAAFTVSANPNPNVPILAYPTNGVTIYTNAPSLNWYLGSAASQLTFDLEVSTVSDFASGVTAYTDISTNYYLISGLLPGGSYYSRVRSKTVDGFYSSWSSTGSFSIYAGNSNMPAVPAFSYPNNGATVWQTSFNLNWYVSSPLQGETYNLQVSLLRDMSSPFVNVQNINEFYYGVSNLTTGTTYYMRLRSKLPNGTYSSFTAVDSFFVGGSVQNSSVIPVFSYPTGGVTIYTTSPSINWYLAGSAPAQDYNLQVATDNAFAGLLVDVQSIQSISYNITGLSLGTTYYTRVRSRAVSGNTYSAWSNTGSFTVSSNGYAVTPLPGNPISGQQITTSSPQLSWYIPTAAQIASYQVEYAAGDASPKIISDIYSFSVALNNLTANTSYKWRVSAKNQDGSFTAPSPWEQFSVGEVSAIQTNKVLPEAYSLGQNYPNPFNPSTSISFSVKNSGNVVLKVYNALGNEVASLVDEYKPAGNYKVSFNALKLSSGVYYYRLIAAGFNSAKKMILMK